MCEGPLYYVAVRVEEVFRRGGGCVLYLDCFLKSDRLNTRYKSLKPSNKLSIH